MDIALHDTLSLSSNLIIAGQILKAPKTLSKTELGPFTVGLIDGDGSLQVNHWRKKNLQFRLVVKLADKPLNFEMLNLIAKTYGGFVKAPEGKGYVQWVVNDRKIFNKNIIPLFEQYPPLTSRMKLQYLFFKNFILNSGPLGVEQYFNERNLKYENREFITPTPTLPLTLPQKKLGLGLGQAGLRLEANKIKKRPRSDLNQIETPEMNELRK